MEPIAIIGMGLRFPGSAQPAEFWASLRDGVDQIEESRKTKIGNDSFKQERTVHLEESDHFDWKAFRVSPREARFMDPQHRLLMEVAWDALEDAGLPFEQVADSETAVYAGLNFTDFYHLLSAASRPMNGYALLGNVYAMAANRISHTFNLKGPSHCVSVGCVSSIAALHEACKSLRCGESELALAGGVELVFSSEGASMLADAGVLSKTGQCRSLAAGADGYVRGEGAAMVVLRAASRLQPGDRVYGYITGSAMNHNGRNEWIMATAAEPQRRVLERACNVAQADPLSLDYVELHGSALPKGDREEALALHQLWNGRTRETPCRIGAVTNNLGYLGAAGGMAAMIKVLLSMVHRTLPPTLHTEQPNPDIPFDEWGLKVQSGLESWPLDETSGPSALLSTSLGGANGALLLRHAPVPEPSPEHEGSWLLTLSSHSTSALRRRVRDFICYLARSTDSIRDICYTATRRRSHQAKRLVVIAPDRAAMIEALERACEADVLEGRLLDCGLAEERNADLFRVARCFLENQITDWQVIPEGRCVTLPRYAFDKKRYWPDTLKTGPEEKTTEPIGPAPDKVVSTEPLFPTLCRIIGEIIDLEPEERLCRKSNFFELGFNSMGILRLRERLDAAYGMPIPAAIFFEYPFLGDFVEHLEQRRAGSEPVTVHAEQRTAGDVEQLSEADVEARILARLTELELDI